MVGVSPLVAERELLQNVSPREEVTNKTGVDASSRKLFNASASVTMREKKDIGLNPSRNTRLTVDILPDRSAHPSPEFFGTFFTLRYCWTNVIKYFFLTSSSLEIDAIAVDVTISYFCNDSVFVL